MCGKPFLFALEPTPGKLPEIRCPVCGERGSLANIAGAYQIGPDGNTVFTPVQQILSDDYLPGDAERQISELKAFFLEAAQNTKLERKAIVEQLERVPVLGHLIELVPHTRAELYTFVALIITMLNRWRPFDAKKAERNRQKRARKGRAVAAKKQKRKASKRGRKSR
jgi:hypothetical protein